MMLCVGFDQYTKVLARSHLPKTRSISFANDTVRLDYLENKGAVLSFEYFLPDLWRGRKVTAAVSVFLALFIPYLMFGSRFRAVPTVCLALFAGGTFSNMLDRVALGGYVIDFLNIGWGPYRTCIFNVADAAIVSGMVLFMLSASWHAGTCLARNSRRSVAR
jgi:signal peptidase II